MSNLDNAQKTLQTLIAQYQSLNETEKFALGKTFREATGGKLSPYNSPQPVAVALIPVFNPITGETWLLAGRRAIAPKIGEVALPGGFFEANEHGQEAAKREVLEETGLDLDPSKFTSYHRVLTSPTNNALTFMLYMEGIPLSLKDLNDIHKASKNGASETSEIVLIGANDSLAFPFHEEAVSAYFKDHRLDCDIEWIDEYVPFSERPKATPAPAPQTPKRPRP